jgi:hypothetical protein
VLQVGGPIAVHRQQIAVLPELGLAKSLAQQVATTAIDAAYIEVVLAGERIPNRKGDLAR